MSKVVQAVVGVAEIVIGAYIDSPGLILAGVGQLLGYAAQLLNSPHRSPVQATDINYAGTLEPRIIIYGMVKTGGMHAIPPMTSGSNNDMLHEILVIAGHSPAAFADVYTP